MRSTIRWVGLVVVVVVAAVLGRSASARQWTEDMFQDKPSAGRPFIAAAGGDLAHAHSVIGAVRFYQAQPQDTFLDIARYYGLGYNELEEANPASTPGYRRPATSSNSPPNGSCQTPSTTASSSTSPRCGSTTFARAPRVRSR